METSTKNTIQFDRQDLSDAELLSLYHNLIKPRMIEEKMLNLLRQGQISKWFSGIGQEAISVGCTMAMKTDEVIFPMHRNLGVFTSREVPFQRLFSQWQGKANGFTKGRDRSFHFGAKDYNIVGMISHLGPQLSLAAGVALAYKLKAENKVSLAFTGEGGTSQGEFHEALNVAAVWNLPVLFVIENNGYGLSTPASEQFACQQLADRGVGYGIESVTIDGNNILEVFQTVSKLAERARNEQKPFLIECMTFRMRGHEEASGTKYVPEELMAHWAKKDPIENYESYLQQEGIISAEDIIEFKTKLKEDINTTVQAGLAEMPLTIDKKTEIEDVYKKSPSIEIENLNTNKDLRFVDAIASALKIAMQKHDDLVLMGQDIAEYGGVFKITDGFVDLFGKERVRNTPLCESAIIGIALGLSIEGQKSMVEMQFSDFVSCGFNQIVNNLAKSHYRWGQNADVVIRMPVGGSLGAGPFHSQTMEAWFANVPGLKIVYPSNPQDAKGLLLAAFNDPNPVLFFEHKALYRSVSGPVQEGYFHTEIGQSRVHTEGSDLSIITYGLGVHWAEEVCQTLNVSAHILDLRTLMPLDYEGIERAVRATNRVLVLHEATGFGGFGGEIASYISAELFDQLDAPVMRCTSMDTPIPFQTELEKQFLAKSQLAEQIKNLLNY